MQLNYYDMENDTFLFQEKNPNGIVDLDSITIEADAVQLISEDIARKHQVLPIRVRAGNLLLAMSKPVSILAVDDIRFITKKNVIPVIADREVILRKIEWCYAQNQSGKVLEEMQNEYQRTNVKKWEESTTSDINDAPAVRTVNSILGRAVTLNASDIHIEPFEDSVRIRYRIDGSLMEGMTLPKQSYPSVSTRIKIMADMDIAEKRLPQDGRTEMEIDNRLYDFRISSIPTVFGEKIEIRKLDRTGFSYSRETLGFSAKENEIIERVMRMPYGMILVTGPTGSGKSTTIYSLLHELNQVDKNIITIEDPVEYKINGVNQVSVNLKAGLTFADGLRSILRQDPDVIMVGEIRDEETAKIAVRAAITGHIVLSTLHTNDALGALARLQDMGVEPYLLSEAVSCVTAQRLVRCLCDHCKKERLTDEHEMAMLSLTEKVRVYDAVGCPRCNGIGYSGRKAVHEVFLLNQEMKREIGKNQSVEKIRAIAMNAGMTTLFDNCRQLVLDGKTSIQELIKTVYARNK